MNQLLLALVSVAKGTVLVLQVVLGFLILLLLVLTSIFNSSWN